MAFIKFGLLGIIQRQPNTILLDNALATMGAGLPSAMTAAMLYPNQKGYGNMWRWRFYDEQSRT